MLLARVQPPGEDRKVDQFSVVRRWVATTSCSTFHTIRAVVRLFDQHENGHLLVALGAAFHLVGSIQTDHRRSRFLTHVAA